MAGAQLIKELISENFKNITILILKLDIASANPAW